MKWETRILSDSTTPTYDYRPRLSLMDRLFELPEWAFLTGFLTVVGVLTALILGLWYAVNSSPAAAQWTIVGVGFFCLTFVFISAWVLIIRAVFNLPRYQEP